MIIKRELIKVNIPESQPGFLGAGHIACPVSSYVSRHRKQRNCNVTPE
jgi:hypothetical protein